MATENQLAALESWLKNEIPTGMSICEMPGEVCSDVLGKLHKASEEYKEDKRKYGIVKKIKKEIVSELKEQGYIDVRIIGVDEEIVVDQDKIREERVKALEAEAREAEHKEPQRDPFGKRVVAEALRIQEGQGLIPKEEKEPAQTTVYAELIEKFGELRAMVTESVRKNDRIPDREKGYAINWISDAVKDALDKGGNHGE